MAEKKVKFTIDWECWNSYEHHDKWNCDEHLEEPTHYLLDLLRRHDIKAIFYCVGFLKYALPEFINLMAQDGHTIGNHTYYHRMGDSISKDLSVPFRAPRWKGEKRLFSGGFWFRLMPYWWIKREVLKTGIFFVHPHDVLLEHPKCGIRNFDRNIGLKTSRDKLERLVRELEWNG